MSLRVSCGQYACGRKGRLNRGIGPESAGITRASRKPRKSVRHESPLFALAKKLSALRILKPACCGLRSHRVQPSCSSCSVSPMRGVEARARGRGAALPSQVVLLLRDAREGPLRRETAVRLILADHKDAVSATLRSLAGRARIQLWSGASAERSPAGIACRFRLSRC